MPFLCRSDCGVVTPIIPAQRALSSFRHPPFAHFINGSRLSGQRDGPGGEVPQAFPDTPWRASGWSDRFPFYPHTFRSDSGSRAGPISIRMGLRGPQMAIQNTLSSLERRQASAGAMTASPNQPPMRRLSCHAREDANRVSVSCWQVCAEVRG